MKAEALKSDEGQMSKLLTVIVPCYNEEEAIPYFYDEMLRVISQFNKVYPELEFEMLFIDDGSTDRTIEVVKKLREKDKRIRFVSFSRNFGKEAGIYAGLEKSRGDYVVIMDADLQDPPSLLMDMYEAIVKEGYDSAATRRVTRKGEPPIRSFFARAFYRLINKISHTQIVDGARDYRIMTRKMTNAVLSMTEYNRFTKGIYGWVGFRTKWLEYENVERVAGETKWSFWKLLIYAFEGIIGFSTAPLSLATAGGIFLSIIAVLAMIFVFVRRMIYGDPVDGWASQVCIMLLIGGLQLFSVGILGMYLSKTYLETKNRPIYISREEEDDEN